MNLWRSMGGMVQVRLTSADLTAAFRAMGNHRVEAFGIRWINELTAEFAVARKDFRRLKALIKRRGDTLEVKNRRGIYWTVKQLLKRPVLCFGMLFMLALTLYLPTRILFVEVDGNRIVETNRILEAAEGCGLGFGSNRRAIRSEQIKNQLLQQLEDLQWAGVNTYGCRAVISVKERKKEQNAQSNETVTSIVAGRDGIIEHLTVHSGNRLCAPGQAVREGQVLISGYTDCGICIRAGRAEGEVFARTTRNLSCKYPVDFNMKGEITGSEKKISLLIGKKQINFFKDSGISTLGCDKMYSVKYMTLPGGFRLPLALVVQTQTNYELSSGTVSEEAAQQWLSCFARQYLTGQMIAGEIRGKTEQLERSNESLVLQGTYECLEMIGQKRFEEYHFDYGEID